MQDGSGSNTLVTKDVTNDGQNETPKSEEQKYKAMIEENPNNFDAWQTYVALAEKANDKDKLAAVYDELLDQFPLLFVYWKKRADVAVAHGNEQQVRQIYERGVTSIPQSVDLWTQYCVYVAEMSQDLDEIRNLFERAVGHVGGDYVAHTLWDKYILFEESQEEHGRISKLYIRILEYPIRDLSIYWDRYRAHAANRPVTELLEEGEAEKLNAARAARQGAADEAEDRKVIFSWREVIYKRTLAMVEKRSQYEAQILRPYFHIKAIDGPQLTNWRNYLEFEEKEGDDERTIRLYERCLVPCAYYPEFWSRYVHFLEKIGKVENARNALYRATYQIHKRRPELHFALADLEESKGSKDTARKAYTDITTLVPGHAEVLLRHAYFEKRNGNVDRAVEILRTGMTTVQGKGLSYFTVQFAFFLKSLSRIDEAKTLFEDLVKRVPEDKTAWLAYANFCVQVNPQDVGGVFDRALAVTTDKDDRAYLLDRYLEVSLVHLTDVQRIREIQHELYLLQLSPVASSYGAPSLPPHTAEAPLTEAKLTTRRRKRGNKKDNTEARAAKQAKTTNADAASVPATATPTVDPANPASQWYGYGGAAAVPYGQAQPQAQAANGAAAAPADPYAYYYQYQQYYQQQQQAQGVGKPQE